MSTARTSLPLGLFAALVLTGCGSGSQPDEVSPTEVAGQAGSPVGAPLVLRALTGRGEPGAPRRDRLLVLPVGGTPEPLQTPTFSGGDAQFPFVVAGERIVYRCSEGACVRPLDPEARAEPVILGDAWCLADSADPGRAWLVQLDSKRPNRAREVSDAREIDVATGTETAELELPPGVGCTVGSFGGGLLFQDEDGLVAVGGAAGTRTPIPDIFPAGGSGDLVASIGPRARSWLRLSDLASGEERRLDAPRRWRFEPGYGGAFSPDGSILAASVVRADDDSNHPPAAVAILDVATNRARVLGGSADGNFSFAPEGRALNVIGGPVPSARSDYPSAITSWTFDSPDDPGPPRGRRPFVTQTRLDLLYMQAG